MVFMEDSERAAAIALQQEIDAGLHLNLTTPFSAPNCPVRLVERQHELSRYLTRHPLARAVFHPGLARSFEYVVSAQVDEFCRLYEKSPARLDGHHHMHLCANVLLGGLLPRRTIVRRHFSHEPGEKVLRNGAFRAFTGAFLSRRPRLVAFIFSLPSLEPPNRLQRVVFVATQGVAEAGTLAAVHTDYRF